MGAQRQQHAPDRRSQPGLPAVPPARGLRAGLGPFHKPSVEQPSRMRLQKVTCRDDEQRGIRPSERCCCCCCCDRHQQQVLVVTWRQTERWSYELHGCLFFSLVAAPAAASAGYCSHQPLLSFGWDLLPLFIFLSHTPLPSWIHIGYTTPGRGLLLVCCNFCFFVLGFLF
ncbi:hypothetical protein BKA81DRAFT_65315 [Phyllosticta paracitricarpa]|uniref:Uncharacterized protein n=2 Tax=Phyllosticta TaxID=121621 RepID=A0ABR1NEM7_9PEZI